MADDFGVYDLAARLETLVSSSIYGALAPPSGNINLRRAPERRVRDENEIAAVRGSPTNFMNVFVIPEVSSSQHEVQSLNAFFSGSELLESVVSGSAIVLNPDGASKETFYSKRSQLVRVVYAVTASIGLPEIPGNERGPSTVENLSRATFDPVSGSYRNNSYFNPAVFEIDVPDYGRIRDVKVWVELVHDIRSGPGTIGGGSVWGGTGDLSPNRRQGLQGLQIALRSPNSSFENAHPLWNDRRLLLKGKSLDNSLPSRFQCVPELLRCSYLLWAGHSVETDLGETLGSATSSLPDEYYMRQRITSGVLWGSSPASNTQTSIAVDKENRPHVVFRHYIDGAVVYGKIAGSSWSFKHVSSGSVDGNYMRLRLSQNNQPRIVYTPRGADNSIKFAYSDDGGSTWSTEFAFTRGSGDQSGFEFTLGQDGTPCVVSSTTSAVFFLRRTGIGTWSFEKIFEGNFGDIDDSLSLAFDSQGQPHVVFASVFDLDVRHAVSGTNGWTVEVIPNSKSPGWIQQARCTIDPSDTLYVVARWDETDASDAGIRMFVSSSSEGWSTRQLHTSGIDGTGGVHTNVTLDKKSGCPVFSWHGYMQNQVRVASLGENGTSLRIVGTGSNSSTQPALETDYLGNQHLVYVHHAAGSLIYAVTSGSQENFTTGIRYTAGGVSSSMYHSYDRDIDMRTIFWDSSTVSNPRHDLADAGSFRTRKLITSGKYASPSSASLGTYFKYPNYPVVLNSVHWMTGSNVPWMLDDRIPPGMLYGRNFSTATGSDGVVLPTSSFPVPAGWLSGPGGAAAENEWPTRGMSLGPNDIRPVYPLLDDVFVRKSYDERSKTSIETIPAYHTDFLGFRPGLRGTEVHGKWKLLVGNNADFDGSVGMTGSIRDGWWFRQFRLEFLLQQGGDISWTYPSKQLRFRKSGTVVSKPGNRLIESISGSAAWDIGVNEIFVSQPEEYGRSVGITDVTGSTAFAVFTQLTGTFVDILSGSGKLDAVKSTFLSNEFGTPYIPLSSGSAEIPSFDTFDISEATESREIFQKTLNPKTLIPQDNTLRAHLARSGVIRSTRDFIMNSIALIREE